MTDWNRDVLYEDNHLLVVNKPAELPTMGVRAGRANLLEQAKRYIAEKYDKPGKVYLGVVSRLDAPVTGALVIARTSKAASRLTAQFRAGDVEKEYWTVTVAAPSPASGECVDLMRKDDRHRKMFVTKQEGSEAKLAKLDYQTLEELAGGRALVRVNLHTGRKHQIRVQLAHRGWAVWGDRKYGGELGFEPGIALHSRRIAFSHPVRDQSLELICPLPPSWDRLKIQYERNSGRES
ncbi:MAG: RluA family pseudouridine synthase [Pirellulaceae bacterium]|jgi:23S rRNA pseudouridine1911/1915/1917 synthase|nr:RluA family pseudouridine synthase [Pirellulaceae bacterium]MDP7016607.1 RluA family pseudouridine synthase [Pirellulaceae bacterium]